MCTYVYMYAHIYVYVYVYIYVYICVHMYVCVYIYILKKPRVHAKIAHHAKKEHKKRILPHVQKSPTNRKCVAEPILHVKAATTKREKSPTNEPALSEKNQTKRALTPYERAPTANPTREPHCVQKSPSNFWCAHHESREHLIYVIYVYIYT